MQQPKREHSWRGPEFLYKKKTPIWYTNVSVFFFIVFVALLFLNNVLGMAVLAFAFWFFLAQANERPRIVDYKIDALGIHVEDRLISYQTIEAFSVESIGQHTVIVFDPMGSLTFPTSIVIKKHELEEVREILLRHLPQQPGMPFIARITHRLHY